MFMLMLRCGLRVEEVTRLKLPAIDWRRRQLFCCTRGKAPKDRLVYLSDDSYEALGNYLRVRPTSRAKEVFLVGKGRCKGKGISVRGSRNAWNIMPGKQVSRCHAINCGTPWRRNCSMPTRP